MHSGRDSPFRIDLRLYKRRRVWARAIVPWAGAQPGSPRPDISWATANARIASADRLSATATPRSRKPRTESLIDKLPIDELLIPSASTPTATRYHPLSKFTILRLAVTQNLDGGGENSLSRASMRVFYAFVSEIVPLNIVGKEGKELWIDRSQTWLTGCVMTVCSDPCSFSRIIGPSWETL